MRNTLAKVYKRWLAVSGYVSGLIVLVMAAITLIDIIGRATGWYSILGIYEMSQALMVWVVFIGIAYAHHLGSNIRSETISQRVGPKTRDIILLVSLLIGLFVFSSVFYTNTDFTYLSVVRHEILAGIPRPTPVWPIKIAIPFGVFFLLIQFTIDIVQMVRRWMRSG